MNNDLIKRNLAISYAASGLVRRIDGEDWIRISEVKQSLSDVPAVEQQGDLISRSELIKEMCVEFYTELYYPRILNTIHTAPTVDLTKNQAYDKGFITAMKLYSRPQGEWKEAKAHIYLSNEDCKEWTNFYCSVCDVPSCTPSNFCPNCGADMRKAVKNEIK